MSPSAPVRPPAPLVILAALGHEAASPEARASAASMAGRTPGAMLHLLHVVERPIGREAAALELLSVRP